MDINFHYFAVKTIARFAGFSENEAQRIAGYSQFVDDYNPFLNYTFETIPDFMLRLMFSSSSSSTDCPASIRFNSSRTAAS